MPETLCLCATLVPVAHDTRVVLIVHHDETHKPSSTGRFLANVLTRCEVHVRGGPDREPLHLPDLGRAAVLFPSDDARELTSDMAIETLVVPEGNWGQAQRVARRVAGLRDVPRVKLPQPQAVTRRLRDTSRDDGLPTAEAVLRALSILEAPAVAEALDAAYSTWFARFSQVKAFGVPTTSPV